MEKRREKFEVSTHSRLKAAGAEKYFNQLLEGCFNTQPPEGGWHYSIAKSGLKLCFNTQPPEGGWDVLNAICRGDIVSTHSRLKAAGWNGLTLAIR